ncbi:MAG TPA: hypothetical protein VLD37_01400 [Candidatus Bilamarchaeum sp.]|nr:hypothetical protein [Candidatus Bilamarchaeum sp.]
MTRGGASKFASFLSWQTSDFFLIPIFDEFFVNPVRVHHQTKSELKISVIGIQLRKQFLMKLFPKKFPSQVLHFHHWLLYAPLRLKVLSVGEPRRVHKMAKNGQSDNLLIELSPSACRTLIIPSSYAWLGLKA